MKANRQRICSENAYHSSILCNSRGVERHLILLILLLYALCAELGWSISKQKVFFDIAIIEY